MSALFFKFVSAILNEDGTIVPNLESLTQDELNSYEGFRLTVFDTNILCKETEEIKWFALMIPSGEMDFESTMELVKEGRKAQKIRMSNRR